MTAKSFVLIAATSALICAMPAADKSGEKSHKLTSISPRKMADSLHAVIAADREAYARLIVQRLHADEQRLPATENWREAHGLPVHAQMLREAGQNIQKRGAEFSYTLRSLWPINGNYGPQTEVEQAGLEHVARHPGENYYTEELLGGRSYFTAIYADRATLPSCVACHNQHPRSPRRDFNLDEVMGAMVVRVPLEF
ncbi:MAG: DUF3365 domain-containing protein [Chloroflexi bacterium]|nr:DUF3365 domain-containing protein [Chloroflexota bacterium]